MKLDQTCPDCGITEALGAYCTKCAQATQEGWIHRPVAAIAAVGRKPPIRRRQSRRAADLT